MKQKVVTIFVLLFAFVYAKGQDKIVTVQKDTIYCRIISISATHIQYEQKDNNQNRMGKFIPIEQVAEYIPSSQLHETPYGAFVSKQPQEPFDRWRIGIEGGGAYLLSFSNIEKNMQDMGIPQSKIDDYRKSYRNGMSFGADVHYLITPSFGAGLRYSMFTTSARMDYALYYGYIFYSYGYGYGIPTYYTINEKEKIYVNYIGPSAVFQHWLDKNHKFRMNGELSIGYFSYREEDRIDPLFIDTYQGNVSLGNILTEGNTWGGNIQLSFEYYPLSWLSVGANIGASLATFKSMKISTEDISVTQDLNADNYMNMSHINYSLGLRFHF